MLWMRLVLLVHTIWILNPDGNPGHRQLWEHLVVEGCVSGGSQTSRA